MKFKYVVAMFCFLASFVITSQLTGTAEVSVDDELNAFRNEQLQSLLMEEQAKNDTLSEAILGYQTKISEYETATAEVGGYTKILIENLETAKIAAGLTDVYGEGVIITVTDSTMENNFGSDENNFIVHDEDLLRIINEVRDAGAEALSLNGERILATSEIRCSGSTVSVNNTRYTAPFVIKAIGPADEIERVLSMRQGVSDILSQWGIIVEVEKVDNLEISAYNNVISYKYVQSEVSQ